MLGASITCPRSVSSQVYRASYDRTCTSEQYFRWSIWYPYLDSAVMHINQMFGDKSRMPFKLCSLLQCFEICSITFQEVYTFYRHVLTCDEDVLFQELKRFDVWRCLSEETCRLFKKTDSAISQCKRPFSIAVTISVTSCTPERTFNAMKILKSRLRLTMAEDGLNGLALLYIPFKHIVATYSTKLFNSIPIHNSPATRAREVFKPSTDSVRRLVSIEQKHLQFWVWGSVGGTSHVGCFCVFMSYLTRP